MYAVCALVCIEIARRVTHSCIRVAISIRSQYRATVRIKKICAILGNQNAKDVILKYPDYSSRDNGEKATKYEVNICEYVISRFLNEVILVCVITTQSGKYRAKGGKGCEWREEERERGRNVYSSPGL